MNQSLNPTYIREARVRRGLRQKEFFHALQERGLNLPGQAAVSYLEAGKRFPSSLLEITAVADILGLPESDVLDHFVAAYTAAARERYIQRLSRNGNSHEDQPD